MFTRSLNKVTLIGNLTKDPIEKDAGTTKVSNFTVATNRGWRTQSGEDRESVEFHRIVAWGKLSELVGKVLKRGYKVYLEGRITYRTFTDKTGVERSITEIVLDDFISLEKHPVDEVQEASQNYMESFSAEDIPG